MLIVESEVAFEKPSANSRGVQTQTPLISSRQKGLSGRLSIISGTIEKAKAISLGSFLASSEQVSASPTRQFFVGS